MMSLLGMAVFGLIVGVVAKLLMPGKDPGGLLVTMGLGVAGAVLVAGIDVGIVAGSDAGAAVGSAPTTGVCEPCELGSRTPCSISIKSRVEPEKPFACLYVRVRPLAWIWIVYSFFLYQSASDLALIQTVEPSIRFLRETSFQRSCSCDGVSVVAVVYRSRTASLSS